MFILKWLRMVNENNFPLNIRYTTMRYFNNLFTSILQLWLVRKSWNIKPARTNRIMKYATISLCWFLLQLKYIVKQKKVNSMMVNIIKIMIIIPNTELVRTIPMCWSSFHLRLCVLHALIEVSSLLIAHIPWETKEMRKMYIKTGVTSHTLEITYCTVAWIVKNLKFVRWWNVINCMSSATKIVDSQPKKCVIYGFSETSLILWTRSSKSLM